MSGPVFRSIARLVGASLLAAVLLGAGFILPGPSPAQAALGSVPAGWVVRVSVPDAIGGKTVIGQLTVDRATEWGNVTAYGCDDGIPTNSGGGITRSDLNYDGRVTPAASNRLIVQADAAGDICFYTSARVDMIVDVNAVSFDVGITSFPNRRTDTRTSFGAPASIPAGGVVPRPGPRSGRTQDRDRPAHRRPRHVLGLRHRLRLRRRRPRRDRWRDHPLGRQLRRARPTPAAANRLIVQADADGEDLLPHQRAHRHDHRRQRHHRRRDRDRSPTGAPTPVRCRRSNRRWQQAASFASRCRRR